jgi:uncharacterized membrane protein YfcA
MTSLIIIITACLVAVFLTVYGAVNRESGTLATGTGILGALLGAAGVKYQPQAQALLKKIKRP